MDYLKYNNIEVQFLTEYIELITCQRNGLEKLVLMAKYMSEKEH